MQQVIFRTVSLALVLAMAVGALAIAPAPAQAEPDVNPAPVQIFYVTLPEGDGLAILQAINTTGGTVPASSSPMYTYFSIAIGVTGTYVYYDQWENGYDSDIANPTNLYSAGNLGGTQVWGNGVAADGCPPNKAGVVLTCADENDVLNAGDVVIPFNAVPLPRNTSTILFDAKDKIGASASIAMARATWATGSGTLNAFAHEIYSTAEWGTTYESPVGCNTTNAGSMFEYSGLSIMAAQNGTPIRVDADGNGTWDYTGTLNEGGAYLEGFRSRTGCDYVWQGARVESSDPTKPIQVVLVTGDIGSSYASRDMNLLPVSAYGSSYWSPVAVDTTGSGPTRLFIYRPSSGGPTHITCDRRGASSLTQAVAVRGVVTVDLVNNNGARCYASDSSGAATGLPIFAIGTVDTDDTAHDWSFTLFPDEFLSTEALVGLGLGRDPTSNTTTTQNGGPLWVTSACTSGGTYVYVDWNNDGIADLVDLNGDGDTTDTVDGINESTSSNGMLVTRLQSVRLYEPGLDTEPYDQSGARVWSRTVAGKPNRTDPTAVPGCSLALAWGQDPQRASPGAPGLDVGTSIPPLRLVEGTKSVTFAPGGDIAPLDVLNPGDTITYLISVKNSGALAVNNVYVYDTVPANTVYVANSTQQDVGSGWAAVSDDPGFPLDTPPGILLGNLAAGATFYVRFNVTLLPGDYEGLLNCDVVTTDGADIVSCATTTVATRDWGDLPDAYGTSASANGPRHSDTGLKLGAVWDVDEQGVPSTPANGDDITTSADEDGVSVSPLANWGAGQGAFNVTVTNGPGCLNAWMDFTNGTVLGPDGDFNDTHPGGYSERIINNLNAPNGTSTVNVSLPTGLLGANNVSFYFRFRLSPLPCATINPTGFVAGGEVEDYRFTFTPLAVTLAEFGAAQQGDMVLVTWETASELNNRGFNLYRGVSPAGWDRQLNTTLIPSQSQGSPSGFVYTWQDRADLVPGVTYYYWLEDLDVSGAATLHGPVSVDFSVPTAVTLNGVSASPATASALPWLWAVAAAGAALGVSRLRRRS